MMTWLAIGIGGAVGSLARHGVNIATARWVGQPISYATFTVNVTGSFGQVAIGYAAAYAGFRLGL